MATWFVTGASRGIGLGICKGLLAKGEVVIGSCRNPDGARDLWELASDFKTHFRTVALDVSDADNVARLAKEFAKERIDVLVNNAGVLKGDGDGLATLKLADLTKSFEVNSIAPLRVTQALLPALKRSDMAKIVNITSKMGSITDNNSGGYYAYRMSKAALNMFNRSLAAEFPEMVALVLHPGWVQTQMGGENAPVDVYASAEGLIQVILKSKLGDSGSFMDYTGVHIPW